MNKELQEFLGRVKDQVLESKKKFGGCYLAVLDHDDHFEIDVEVSEGTIAGSFIIDSHEKAVEAADELERLILVSTGCKVFHSREEWEDTHQ
jgi:hypothetical protein